VDVQQKKMDMKSSIAGRFQFIHGSNCFVQLIADMIRDKNFLWYR